MTWMLFTGCVLISFAPLTTLFVLFICRSPVRVVLFFVGCFLMLLSVALGSLVWFAVVPLRDQVAFALPFSVVIMELARYAAHYTVKRLQSRFNELSDDDLMYESRHKIALVFGIGFGTVSAFITMPVILQHLTGPGNFGLRDQQTQYFAVYSSVLCLAFTLLQVVWNIVGFEAAERDNRPMMGVVLALHLISSFSTLANSSELYYISLPTVYLTLAASTAWAAHIVGCTKESLYNAFTSSNLVR